MSTGFVRMGKRRANGDRIGTRPPNWDDIRRLDNCLLRVCADADGYVLAIFEGHGLGDLDDGRTYVGNAIIVVAPAVPTAAMTRVSILAPRSIVTFLPTWKPLTFATLIFVAPTLAAAERGADVWV